jgi:hypothetical protein
LCQRYYEVISWDVFNWNSVSRTGDNKALGSINWVEKRAVPTAIFTGTITYNRSGVTGASTTLTCNPTASKTGARYYTGDLGAAWVPVEIVGTSGVILSISAEL